MGSPGDAGNIVSRTAFSGFLIENKGKNLSAFSDDIFLGTSWNDGACRITRTAWT